MNRPPLRYLRNDLDFGDYPGDGLIRKLAKVLGADEQELLLLAEKTPEDIRRRVIQRPDVFRKIARLDDKKLDRLLAEVERLNKT